MYILDASYFLTVVGGGGIVYKKIKKIKIFVFVLVKNFHLFDTKLELHYYNYYISVGPGGRAPWYINS